MTKGAYVGVGGVARKIKKGYVGVDGKARKIKKAYIGVGGVARPCWGGEELKYYGVVTHLSEGRASLAATTVGDYALFGGGYNSGYRKAVEAYTGALVHSTASSLSEPRDALAATTVGGYALFGGGIGGDRKAVDAYTGTLVRSTAASLSAERSNLAATTVGGYALFGGGIGGGPTATVDAYTASLVHSTAASLSEPRAYLAATTVGGYALFGGGCGDSLVYAYTTVDTYTASLVHSTAASLSEKRAYLAATTVGGYALFGGGVHKGGVTRGVDTNVYSATVDAYTGALVHSTAPSLSEPRDGLAATTVGDYALFGGGTAVRITDAVDAYTAPPLKTGTLRIKTVWGVIAYYGDETVEDEQDVSLPINANNLKVTAVYYEIPTYTDIVSTNVSWTSQPGRKTDGVAWVLDPTKDASIVWAD